MLKSRGDATSTSTSTSTPSSAPPSRVPDHISSSSYSFNQLHPILPPPGAIPPRTPPHSTSTSNPPLPTSVPKDAHFPKLPSAPSLAPRPSLSSTSLPPPATKWAARNRKITAAEVVASKPPDANHSSTQEEAAAKELENFALLVPVVSATPRNPAGTTGQGGLRSTGSLVTLQQRQKAGSKSKHPSNGLCPSSSLPSKDSASRLQSLTSQSKLQTTRKAASIPVVPGRGKTNGYLNANQPKLSEASTLNTKKEPVSQMAASLSNSKLIFTRPEHHSKSAASGRNAARITSNGHPDEIVTSVANISVTADPSNNGEFVSRSSAERTRGIHRDRSAMEESGTQAAEYMSESIPDMNLRRAATSKLKNITRQAPKATFPSRNSGYASLTSTQDVRISRTTPLSPKAAKSNTPVSEKDVLELRRQAFAPSADSRSVRSRNSAFQSSRKSNPTLSRRNQTPSISASNTVNNRAEPTRSTNSFQNSLENRLSSRRRDKVVAFEHDRSLSPYEDPLSKSSPRLDNRAEGLKVNSKKLFPKKNATNLEESKCLDLGLATENGWNRTTRYSNECKTSEYPGLTIGVNGAVSNPTPVPFAPMDSSLAGTAVNSSDLETKQVGVSNYPSTWAHFDTNYSLNPDSRKASTSKRKKNNCGGPSRILKGNHEESQIASESSGLTGNDRVHGRFAKSPIFGSIGNGSDAWIPTIDGPHNEAISKIFLAAEAEAAELRGSSRPTMNRRDVADSECCDAKKRVGEESAIDKMIRLQSNARSRMSSAKSVSTSNAGMVTREKLMDGMWATMPGFEANISVPKPGEEFELPPLPEPHDALFDSALKMFGGYPDDEEVACDGPCQFQKRTYRHFNSNISIEKSN